MKLFRKIYGIPWLFAIFAWLFAIALLVLATDKIIMPAIAGRWTDTVAVPDVQGMSVDSAQLALQAAQIEPLWASDTIYSSTVPLGHVLTQSPAPGRSVKVGRSVYLTLSKGVQEVRIPDLRGKSRRQAEISIQRLGLVCAPQDARRADPTVPKGIILGVEPLHKKVGGRVRVGDTVRIVVSSGGRLTVPLLAGKSLVTAQHILDSLHFAPPVVTRAPDSLRLPGTVISQTPGPGGSLAAGSSLELVVAE